MRSPVELRFCHVMCALGALLLATGVALFMQARALHAPAMSLASELAGPTPELQPPACQKLASAFQRCGASLGEASAALVLDRASPFRVRALDAIRFGAVLVVSFGWLAFRLRRRDWSRADAL